MTAWLKPNQIFQKHYHVPNPLTPNVIGYGWIEKDKLLYELSDGDSENLGYSCSVTVLKLNGMHTEELREKNGVFDSKWEAEEYILKLRKKWKEVFYGYG